MSIKTIFEEDVQLLTQQAGEKLQELCSETHTPLLLLVSGGSALDILDTVSLRNASHLTIGMLDERYSPDMLNNNFIHFQTTALYSNALSGGATFLDTSLQNNKTMNDIAFIMENTIRNWRRDNPEGRIYIVEGVGGDGHTAGIMPFPEDQKTFETLFDDPSVLVISYDAKDKNPIPLRITVTYTFLKDWVDEAIVYIVGDSKRDVLQNILAPEGNCHEIPARVVKEMKSVTLFTDITI